MLVHAEGYRLAREDSEKGHKTGKGLETLPHEQRLQNLNPYSRMEASGETSYRRAQITAK